MAITNYARTTKTGSGTVDFASSTKTLPAEVNTDWNALVTKINAVIASVNLNDTHRAATKTITGKFHFEIPGNASVAAGVTMPQYCDISAITITEVHIKAETAPTGASIKMDVNKGGVTLYTTQANRPEIPIGDTSRIACTLPDITALVADDVLTVDFDQVGSVIAGADVQLDIVFTQNVAVA